MWLIRGKSRGECRGFVDLKRIWKISGRSREDLGRVSVSISRGSVGSQENLGRISGGYQLVSQEDL